MAPTPIKRGTRECMRVLLCRRALSAWDLAALAPIPAFPPVSLSCSSRSSGMFVRWFCRLPPVSLACASSLVCSSCVAPVSSSRAWVSGDGKRGHLLGNLRICWAIFARTLKAFPNRSQMAPRRLQNGSKMAPEGVPGASREANFIYAAFLASRGALLGAPGALLGRSWGALGVVLGRSRALLGRSWGSVWPPEGHCVELV